MVAGYVPVGHVAAAHGPATPSVQPARAPAAAPLAPPVCLAGTACAVGVFTSTFTINVGGAQVPYILIPYHITYNATIANATMTAANFSASLSIDYVRGNCIFHEQFGFSYFCPRIWTTALPFSQNTNLTSTSASFWFDLGTTNLTSTAYRGYTLPQGNYRAVLSISAGNSSVSMAPSCADSPPVPTPPLAPCATAVANFALTGAPVGNIYSPGATVAAGTVTISGNYTGYFITGAAITVVQTPAGNVVVTAGVFTPGSGQRAYSVGWQATTPGTFQVTLNLTAQWGLDYLTTETVTVSAPPPIAYKNSTYSGQISGLGNGGSAALLITVGAVVGIIVMALVGRAIWAAPKPAAAQPWAPKAGQNECSVCHQTFATEDELKEHQKTQHGMTM